MGNRCIELKVELGDIPRLQAFAQLAPNETPGVLKARHRRLRIRSASENQNHAAACDSISRAGIRDGATSPRRAAS
jgi:hypothetical protein